MEDYTAIHERYTGDELAFYWRRQTELTGWGKSVEDAARIAGEELEALAAARVTRESVEHGR